MRVKLATAEVLKARGYIQSLDQDGGLVYTRMLPSGKKVGIRQSTLEALASRAWDWNNYDEQKEVDGIPMRRFKGVLEGKWVPLEMVVESYTEQVPEVPARHSCYCPIRELMWYGCRCGGI
jgi:hypothetical protein